MASAEYLMYGGVLGSFAAAKAIRDAGLTGSIKIIVPETTWGGMHLGGIVATDIGSNPTHWGYWKAMNQRVADIYAGVTDAELNYAWRFEPHLMRAAAEAEFAALLADPDFELILGAPIESVSKVNGIIEGFTADGVDYEGSYFSDHSYEGDLSRLAGIPGMYGRESIDIYREIHGGIAYADAVARSWPLVDAKGNSYRIAQPGMIVPDGYADARIQGYNFRMLWSQNVDRLPWQAPPGYRREDFLDRLHEINTRGITHILVTDWWNTVEINGDLSGGSQANRPRIGTEGLFSVNANDQYMLSSEWVTGTRASRAEIVAELYYRLAGLLYFCANDAALSGTDLQASAQSYGLSPLEWQEEGNYYGQQGWPPFPYVREAYRPIGQRIGTFADFAREWEDGQVPDSIMRFNYFVDKHTVSYETTAAGTSIKEGHRDATGYQDTSLPYGCILPFSGHADNLLFGTCISITSTLWQPWRMEPSFMMNGQVCGMVMAEAKSSGRLLNDVPYESLLVRLNAASAIL